MPAHPSDNGPADEAPANAWSELTAADVVGIVRRGIEAGQANVSGIRHTDGVGWEGTVSVDYGDGRTLAIERLTRSFGEARTSPDDPHYVISMERAHPADSHGVVTFHRELQPYLRHFPAVFAESEATGLNAERLPESSADRRFGEDVRAVFALAVTERLGAQDRMIAEQLSLFDAVAVSLESGTASLDIRPDLRSGGYVGSVTVPAASGHMQLRCEQPARSADPWSSIPVYTFSAATRHGSGFWRSGPPGPEVRGGDQRYRGGRPDYLRDRWDAITGPRADAVFRRAVDVALAQRSREAIGT